MPLKIYSLCSFSLFSLWHFFCQLNQIWSDLGSFICSPSHILTIWSVSQLFFLPFHSLISSDSIITCRRIYHCPQNTSKCLSLASIIVYSWAPTSFSYMYVCMSFYLTWLLHLLAHSLIQQNFGLPLWFWVLVPVAIKRKEKDIFLVPKKLTVKLWSLIGARIETYTKYYALNKWW